MLYHFASDYYRLQLFNVKATLRATLRFGLDIHSFKPIKAFRAKWNLKLFLIGVLEKLSSEC